MADVKVKADGITDIVVKPTAKGTFEITVDGNPVGTVGQKDTLIIEGDSGAQIDTGSSAKRNELLRIQVNAPNVAISGSFKLAKESTEKPDVEATPIGLIRLQERFREPKDKRIPSNFSNHVHEIFAPTDSVKEDKNGDLQVNFKEKVVQLPAENAGKLARQAEVGVMEAEIMAGQAREARMTTIQAQAQLRAAQVQLRTAMETARMNARKRVQSPIFQQNIRQARAGLNGAIYQLQLSQMQAAEAQAIANGAIGRAKAQVGHANEVKQDHLLHPFEKPADEQKIVLEKGAPGVTFVNPTGQQELLTVNGNGAATQEISKFKNVRDTIVRQVTDTLEGRVQMPGRPKPVDLPADEHAVAAAGHTQKITKMIAGRVPEQQIAPERAALKKSMDAWRLKRKPGFQALGKEKVRLGFPAGEPIGKVKESADGRTSQLEQAPLMQGEVEALALSGIPPYLLDTRAVNGPVSEPVTGNERKTANPNDLSQSRLPVPLIASTDPTKLPPRG